MKLINFDLDQTLVEFTAVHDKTAGELFKAVFNVDARLTDIDFAGKTLTESFRQLASSKNVPEELFKEKKEELLKNYEAAFARNLPSNATEFVLPGVKELLDELYRASNIIMLYTGDSQGIVETVFNATGLGKYFSACFYGTDVKKRADMVAKAVDRAKESTGKHFTDRDIVIIGDSMRDVEAAREFHALMIAVATGVYTTDELSNSGADYAFKDLTDYKAVIRAINNGVNKVV